MKAPKYYYILILILILLSPMILTACKPQIGTPTESSVPADQSVSETDISNPRAELSTEVSQERVNGEALFENAERDADEASLPYDDTPEQGLAVEIFMSPEEQQQYIADSEKLAEDLNSGNTPDCNQFVDPAVVATCRYNQAVAAAQQTGNPAECDVLADASEKDRCRAVASGKTGIPELDALNSNQ